MTNTNLSSSVAKSKGHETPTAAEFAYASATQSGAALAVGAQYRRDRMEAADMMSTDDAAQLAGVSRVTINAWIKSGRCIAVANLRRGFKLPRWQFEPSVFRHVPSILSAIGDRDGWQALAFMESPAGALQGLSPRVALEQGVAPARILALASAEAH